MKKNQFNIILDINTIKKLYFQHKKTTMEIAKLFKCHASTISRRLKRFHFKVRSNSESHKGKILSIKQKEKISQSIKGTKHPMYGKSHSIKTKKKISLSMKGKISGNWMGGITPLRSLIRELIEYDNWRLQVFQRDNYTCQYCGQHGGNLEVHHIKSFSQILNEFLQYYNQLSPIEDKNTLTRLSITWKEFWIIDNGQTLCKPCHDKTKKGRTIDVE